MMDLVFFDTHITLGGFPELPIPYRQSFATARERLAECGIAGGLMEHRQSWENEPAFGHELLKKELAGTTGFRPLWNMLPLQKGMRDEAGELAVQMRGAEVAGALLMPGCCSFSPEEWCSGPLYEMLEVMRMPLFVRMNSGEMEYDTLARLLASHPGLPVILRHLFYQADLFLYPLMDRYENLYVETCGYKPFDGIRALSRAFGCKRLIFGSNYPYESPGAAVAQLLLSDLPPEDIVLIAGKNMLHLMGDINYDL